jgi:mono/diheme cytochrome c family protein
MKPSAETRAALALCAGLMLAGLALGSDDPLTGKQLFVRHCARCHTNSGTGLPANHPLLANFETPPADFSDPLFNSREPRGDWFLVVKHGAARLGLSHQMPAHGGRMTDAEIERVLEHLASFADTRGYPPGELNFTRSVRTIKAFPETELLLLGRYEGPQDGAPAAWRSTLYHARRLGRRFQAEAKLSHLSQGAVSQIHDAELGVKWAFHNRGQSLLLAAGTDLEIPIQSTADATLVPYLSHAAPLGGRFTLQGTLRTHLPLGELGGGDVELSEVVHWLPTPWRRGVFPGLELTAAAPFAAEGRWRLALIPQLHLALSKRGHVALNIGAELPLAGARGNAAFVSTRFCSGIWPTAASGLAGSRPGRRAHDGDDTRENLG